MNWNRAKNIIFFMLLSLNLALAAFCILLNVSRRNSYRETVECAVQILEAHGISCDLSLLEEWEDNRQICVIERNSALEQTATEALLGTVTNLGTGSTDRYQSNFGTLSWVIGGNVEGSVSLSMQETISRLEQVGLKSVLTAESSDSSSTSFLGQEYNGLPVFNTILSLTEDERGQVNISGRCMIGTPVPADSSEPMSLSAVMVEFALSTAGQLAQNVTAVEPGWIVQTLPGVGIRLVPVYRITADGAFTCIHAINGTVVPAE